MAMKRVGKSGVYRQNDGSAVYLAEGAMVDARVLDDATFDESATAKRDEAPERPFAVGVVDAPQHQRAEDTWSERMVAGAPENKAMPSDQRSDAELADETAKGKKR